jgi:hypothetical protein
MRKLSVCLGAVGSLIALLTFVGGTIAAPGPFQLVFDGVHTSATFPSATGLQHEGDFNGQSSFCASGHAADISQTGDSAVRRFTCSDGSGSFDVVLASLVAEHGGSGSWRIVGGSGALSRLRGKGSWSSALVRGNPSDPATVVFRSAWSGVADLDDAAPSLTITRVAVKKLRRPARTYTVALRVATADDVTQNPVSYVATAHLDRFDQVRTGTTRSGSIALSYRFRVAARTRTIRLRVRVGDPVGNEREVVRPVRLPSR